MKLTTRILSVLGLLVAAATLSACNPSESKEQQAAKPPVIFKVTQRNLAGDIVFTDRAISAYPNDGGCVRYTHPDDGARGLPSYSHMICGAAVSVTVEEK